MIVVGIDPGLDGALVALDEKSRVMLQILTDERLTLDIGKGKSTKRAYVEATMAAFVRQLQPDLVVLEKQAGFSPPGRKMGAASLFGIGLGFGLWRGICAGLRAPCLVVAPRTWQADVLRDVPGDDTKARAVQMAAQRVPSLDLTPGRRRKPHEGLADACGLALYGLGRLLHEAPLVAPQDETFDAGGAL